jgi:hypothetical protein
MTVAAEWAGPRIHGEPGLFASEENLMERVFDRQPLEGDETGLAREFAGKALDDHCAQAFAALSQRYCHAMHRAGCAYPKPCICKSAYKDSGGRGRPLKPGSAETVV